MTELTKKQGWTYIAEMQWGMQADSGVIAQKWFKKLGTAGMKKLSNFVDKRVGELYRVMHKFESSDTGRDLEIGSNDGLSDVLHHIVGCGREEFARCFLNPILIEQRYKKFQYRESFAYCFLQPDPPRTKKQMDDSLIELDTKIDNLVKVVDKLQDTFSALSIAIREIKHVHSQVKKDRENNSKNTLDN